MDDTGNTEKFDTLSVIQLLNSCLDNLRIYNKQLLKHSTALDGAISELEVFDFTRNVSESIKAINEHATLLTLTSDAMTHTCSQFLELIETQNRNWKQILQHEHNQRMQLENIIEQLTRQYSILKHVLLQPDNLPSLDHDDENEEFYDAQNEETSLNVVFPTCSVLETIYLYKCSFHFNK